MIFANENTLTNSTTRKRSLTAAALVDRTASYPSDPALVMAPHNYMLCTTRQALPNKPDLRKRRRVQFQPSTSSSAMVHERVHPVESLLHLPQDHKNELWVQNDDIQSSMSHIRRTFQRQDKDSNMVLPTYGKALFDTYIACCNDSKDNEGIPESISARQLELLGATGARGVPCSDDHHSSSLPLRGLESCAIPQLSAKRSKQRRENIANIVAIHQRIKSLRIPGDDFAGSNMLRSVAEQLSRPSRKFAQAMGIGDSLAALTEYTNEMEPVATTTSLESKASRAA
eukprot:CAMPEP_0172442934 /NCGR_PEP_ID=MMETSP1065-20121228/3273_1 /TAXON_ID=265537 /ORGANISM="Amphiprora paludosa, Strain CCMP125" /LENGTH=284 /DNA_ID=CAMNT_0013192981 /DNA_START=26 /DNA_END=880 /DNA_ORIENTATION=+